MVRHLLFLNGLAVVGAVINHASGWGFTSLFWWTDRYRPVAVPDFSQLGTPAYYMLRALEQLIMFSLPAFVVVSGFFLAMAASGQEVRLPWGRLCGRLGMLLVPYVLWSLVIFVGRGFEGATDTSVGYVQQLLFGRAAEPYYYIPLITQLYLLSPFLVRWVKRHGTLMLCLAAVVQLGVQGVRYPVALGWDAPVAATVWRLTPGWFFPHMLFWFVFGIYAGTHLATLRPWLTRGRTILPGLTVGLGVAAFTEWELLSRASGRPWVAPTATVLDSLYSLAFILSFMAWAGARLPGRRSLDALGERSFGVYLIHAPVLELASRGVYHAVPLLLGYPLLFQSLLIAAGIAVPLLLMAMVNRTAVRPFYNYLFG